MGSTLGFIWLSLVIAISAEPEFFCQTSWGYKNYYVENNTPMTWSDAKKTCANHGLTLATVEIEEDKWPLLSCLSQTQYEGRWFWTAAAGSVSNLKWDHTGKRVNSNIFDEIRQWPRNSRNAKCGVMSNDFKYLDTNACSTKHYFLCQKYN